MSRRLLVALFYPSSSERFGAAAEALINGSDSVAPASPHIRAESWRKPEFWDAQNNPYPLNQLIRRLHSFDGAIILLGASDFSSDRPKSAAGKLLSWIGRLGGGQQQPINSNVLIEIGACMARFGRKRTFLLKPHGLPLPSYFHTSNVVALSYDDREKDPVRAVGRAVSEAVDQLGTLGDAAYYSDLPAFGLAHGYFTNFLKPTIESVESKVAVSPVGGTGAAGASFGDGSFVIPFVRDAIVDQRRAAEYLRSIGLVEISIPTAPGQGGRAKTAFTLPDFTDRSTLCVVDVPTNLIPIQEAIRTVEALWTDRSEPDSAYSARLETREIDNFFRYLEILMEKSGVRGDKIVRYEVGDLSEVTREGIEQRFLSGTA